MGPGGYVLKMYRSAFRRLFLAGLFLLTFAPFLPADKPAAVVSGIPQVTIDWTKTIHFPAF
jgi:hypothetical protein